MNRDLPIAQFSNHIVEAVTKNSVVVITAETGSGKSTQVPQILLDADFNMVVTQPRRLAARSVAERVAEEYGEELGLTIGYRLGGGRDSDRCESAATRCLFCTDGLALVRELMGAGVGGKTVLIIDEVHEWNENVEVLVAWAKRQVEKGADFKVILMSATLEAEKLSAFFNGAPVITVPGRIFPVVDKQPGSLLVNDVAQLVREGRNVLVFQPGKQEITETCEALVRMQVGAEILPLHGQLSAAEQARCFQHYSRPKVVVATNVAQTSVTIDDIDAVVDSGVERRVELVDGVEGLYLKPISLADSSQRKGRAGRTRAGIYIDHCGAKDRSDFPVAEIMRKRLDQTALRLAIAGFDMEELEFFHQPDKSDIHRAYETLIGLGCMTKKREVTRIGTLVSRLPVSVQYARMLVEADRLGVVDDILTIAAILEVDGITVPPPSKNRPERPDWRYMTLHERESDVMGQLYVWKLANDMSNDEMKRKGISIRDYLRAKEIRQHLKVAITPFFAVPSSGKREDILKAVCAGMVHHVYQGYHGNYRSSDGFERQLGNGLIRGGNWVVGKPFDLQLPDTRNGGTFTLNLITMATVVEPSWLIEIAPHLVENKCGQRPQYDELNDVVVSVTQTLFNGQVVKEEQVVDRDHPEATAILANWLTQRVLS